MDPDPGGPKHADPDPQHWCQLLLLFIIRATKRTVEVDTTGWALLRIPITLMRIRILILFDADPDPYFQRKAQILKKCSNRLKFHTFWLAICKLMQIGIRIQLITLMRIRILIFIWCGCGSRLPKWFRIRIHNTDKKRTKCEKIVQSSIITQVREAHQQRWARIHCEKRSCPHLRHYQGKRNNNME